MLKRSPTYRAIKVGVAGFGAWRRYRGLTRRADDDSPPGKEEWDAVHEATAQNLFDLAIELQGVWIKSCQLIGARADIFPEPYARILGQCHDKVPPRPFGELRPSIEEELGGPLSEFFDEVDETPLAAASLAQVHKARLKDGSEVVLKVQYPEIAGLVDADLTTMRRLTGRFMPKSNLFDPKGLIDEQAHFTRLELDFSREAESTERIRKALEGDARVRVPRVYPEHSTKKLLVLEFLDGVPLTDPERLEQSGIDQLAFVENVANIYAKMVFEQGFFHGDPHPGNLLVLEGGVIGLLDFGLAKELPDRFGATMAEMIAKTIAGDTDGAMAAAKALGFNFHELSPALLDDLAERMLGDVTAAQQRRGFPTREQQRADRARRKELEGLAKGGEPLRVPPHFQLVIRTVVLLDGLSNRLAPGKRVVQNTLQKAIMPYAMTAFSDAGNSPQP